MSMGLTAERLQRKYGVSREDADAFALASHQKAWRRRRRGRFDDEIVPVNGLAPRTKVRAPTPRLEALAKLKPVFHASGTVTAGNSSQTSDGAAAALVMSEEKARELGLKPKARFVSFAAAGVPPEIMGIGPVAAIPKALDKAGLKLEEIEVIELNEAFAVQALAVIRAAGTRSGARQPEWRRDRAGPSAGMHRGQADGHDSARNGAARGAIRDGDHVRGRRAGRGGDFRAAGE